MDSYQLRTEEEKAIIRTHFTAGSGIAQISDWKSASKRYRKH